MKIILHALNGINAWITSLLPLSVVISLWGVIAGISAMAIYAFTSNQTAISELKLETRNLRRKMMDPSLDDYKEFTRLAKKNLKVSLTFLGKVIGPVLLSTIPILLIAVWLSVYNSLIFFLSVMVAALAVKFIFKIH